jgi:SAM-dependent methyltransferase
VWKNRRVDHRDHVGPVAQYDLMGALQFSILVAAGLREYHTLLDVGCGSLRAGRFLIPYLGPDSYCGIDPERDVVFAGIRDELGESMLSMKQPRFAYRADFDASEFNERFDFAIAQSVFTHTHPDLARVGFARVAEALGPSGVLVGNFMVRRVLGPGGAHACDPVDGSGWEYPGTVRYRWREVTDLAGGLHLERIRFAHPRLSWFVAAHSRDRARAVSFAVPRAYRHLSLLDRLYLDALARASRAKGPIGRSAQSMLRKPLRRHPLSHPGLRLRPTKVATGSVSAVPKDRDL